MEKSLVSVLMPAYNAEKYIGEAIESILNQTYKNFEFIIVDDCSTDNTIKVIEKYMKKDKRIKLYKNKENSGVAITLNNGLNYCSGKYIARMDSDDISLPKRFEKQMKLLKETDADICSTNLVMFSGKKIIGRRIYNKDISKTIFIESPIGHATVILKKELFKKYGNYVPKFNSAEDYDLWLRFYSKGCKFVLCDEFLYKYRQHETTVKSQKTKKILKTTIKVKLNAKKKYKLKFGFKGNIRLIMENIFLLIPGKILLKLFYWVKRK